MAQFAVHGEHVEHEAASPIANAAPLGLSAFALTMALLSCINAVYSPFNWHQHFCRNWPLLRWHCPDSGRHVGV